MEQFHNCYAWHTQAIFQCSAYQPTWSTHSVDRSTYLSTYSVHSVDGSTYLSTCSMHSVDGSTYQPMCSAHSGTQCCKERV